MKSIATPLGPSASTCGYCSQPGQRSKDKSSHHTAGLLAIRLTCDVYQAMINRGWRRSGTFCYKPDLQLSCCPHYTIRLDVLGFKASKSQRKLINRWNRFVAEDDRSEHMDTGNLVGTKSEKKNTFSFVESIHASECAFSHRSMNPLHDFETVLEPSSFTEEKYVLFEKYQRAIHRDDASRSSFKRFLVDSPLTNSPIPYTMDSPPPHLPQSYGSYHLLYKLDGCLVAVDVLDILPHCVSSVYFMYDDTLKKHSLGKLSVLREISLVREMHDAGISGMNFVYLGFYIHTCTKMRYKGEYSPSYLADPETYEWFPLPSCVSRLEKYRYATFSFPDHSLVDLPEEQCNPSLDENHFKNVLVICGFAGNELLVKPVHMTPHWEDRESLEDIMACVNSLGADIAKEVVLTMNDFTST